MPNFSILFEEAGAALDVIVGGAVFWLPLFLGYAFFSFWIHYMQGRYISNITWVMLEVSVPKEINKTPLAMEIVLNAFLQGKDPKWYEIFFQGKVKPWSSLELVSLEGSVKFFIRTEKKARPVVEAQIYAQYPSIEIHEVPDYARYVDYQGSGGGWSIFGSEFILSEKDAYPIATYVDYGLDKDGLKEEFKIDPITPTLEYLGSLGPGEQAWIQILVQPTGKRFSIPGRWFGKQDWKSEGKDMIEKIIKDAKKRGGGENSPALTTEVESNAMKAIERNIAKAGFDCGIRGLYLAKNASFNGDQIGGLMSTWKQYGAQGLNGFRPNNVTDTDHPWEDFKGIRVDTMKREMFNAYRRRAYFYRPYKRKPFVLNSEELATIFHFPGGVSATPTFGRIESRKSEPPPNLPI